MKARQEGERRAEIEERKRTMKPKAQDQVRPSISPGPGPSINFFQDPSIYFTDPSVYFQDPSIYHRGVHTIH